MVVPYVRLSLFFFCPSVSARSCPLVLILFHDAPPVCVVSSSFSSMFCCPLRCPCVLFVISCLVSARILLVSPERAF